MRADENCPHWLGISFGMATIAPAVAVCWGSLAGWIYMASAYD
jgi:hypothetical protein